MYFLRNFVVTVIVVFMVSHTAHSRRSCADNLKKIGYTGKFKDDKSLSSKNDNFMGLFVLGYEHFLGGYNENGEPKIEKNKEEGKKEGQEKGKQEVKNEKNRNIDWSKTDSIQQYCQKFKYTEKLMSAKRCHDDLIKKGYQGLLFKDLETISRKDADFNGLYAQEYRRPLYVLLQVIDDIMKEKKKKEEELEKKKEKGRGHSNQQKTEQTEKKEKSAQETSSNAGDVETNAEENTEKTEQTETIENSVEELSMRAEYLSSLNVIKIYCYEMLEIHDTFENSDKNAKSTSTQNNESTQTSSGDSTSEPKEASTKTPADSAKN